MKKIAIIPARGGSKRIPRKNVKPFMGKPAISYPIEIAISCELFDEIVVTTDDEEIADIGKHFGATQIVKRPLGLADDITPTVPVISHAIQELGMDPEDAVCCIYPVNPFLNVKDIFDGFKLLNENYDISYVNSITSYPYPIQRAVRKDLHSRISMINPELALTRSQDLEECFHDAGQWYWGRAEAWNSNKKLLHNSIGVVIPRWRVQDIDTFEDWENAEKLFSLITRDNPET